MWRKKAKISAGPGEIIGVQRVEFVALVGLQAIN
jgi:hypothetical protein